MFIDFFSTLRKYRVPVSLTEWLTLMQALRQGHALSSLYVFYHLARSILIKDISYYDNYDLAFQEYFEGIESPEEVAQDVLEWLENPSNVLPPLSPEELEQLREIDLDGMRQSMEDRLAQARLNRREQQARNGQGEERRRGRGGRQGGGQAEAEGEGGRSALRAASERRFKNYRGDVTLDVRQYRLALKQLRLFHRIGPQDELDLNGTIDATCRNGGDIDLVWQRERKNTIKLLLLMDSGGSMLPHGRLLNRLFTAAKSATHLKEFRHYYFHNCIYDWVYKDIAQRETMSTPQLFRTLPADYKVILVGDAMMAPEELLMPYGSIDYYQQNELPGIEWLKRLARHFTHTVWLNPEETNYWVHPTVTLIKRLFPMFPLTLDGLSRGFKKLIVRS